jgi:N-glycosylase/DNA lyase
MTKDRDADIKELKIQYSSVKDQINERLKDFETKWNSKNEDAIYCELIFCLLTPQSKALSCWSAVETLIDKDLLFKGTPEKIANELEGVRFHNNKSRNIFQARKQFVKNGQIKIMETLKKFNDNKEKRDWLVANIKGYGYKEASHFLRNIGLGTDLAILDRHILKNLVKYGVIDGIPKNLSKSRYFEIEEKMEVFSNEIGIPMAQLDILFWYKQTGKIFK